MCVAQLLDMIYESGGDVRLGDEPGQLLVTDDLEAELRLALREHEAAVADHLAVTIAEAEAAATVLDVFAGARDVTATQPSSEIVAGFRLIEDWNDTPAVGDPGSQYCRCGLMAMTGTTPPRCSQHRRDG